MNRINVNLKNNKELFNIMSIVHPQLTSNPSECYMFMYNIIINEKEKDLHIKYYIMATYIDTVYSDYKDYIYKYFMGDISISFLALAYKNDKNMNFYTIISKGLEKENDIPKGYIKIDVSKNI